MNPGAQDTVGKMGSAECQKRALLPFARAMSQKLRAREARTIIDLSLTHPAFDIEMMRFHRGNLRVSARRHVSSLVYTLSS